jgi:fringe-like protein
MPGIEDVLIVLKTGVTEALDKVPVHFQTTFRCVPNYAVFSDFKEEIEGVRVHDVLQHVSSEVKQKVSDFDLYNRVQLFGRKGLVAADTMAEVNGPRGMPNNPGWKLDKWKFLPMIDEALRISPNSSWYVFMETDTYLVIPNLITWLSGLDPEEPYYLGTETQIADVTFAHGGSGVILSKPAMQFVSYLHATWPTEVDEYVHAHWAGDCVLGKILAEAGVNLTFSWPMLQNSRLGELDSLADIFYRRPWCYPAVGYHHLSIDEIWDMWRFDQDWFQKVNCPSSPSSSLSSSSSSSSIADLRSVSSLELIRASLHREILSTETKRYSSTL